MSTIVVCTVRLHLPKLRAQVPQNTALWLYDPKVPDNVAGIVQGDGKIVLGRIELDLAAENYVLEKRQAAFPWDAPYDNEWGFFYNTNGSYGVNATQWTTTLVLAGDDDCASLLYS